MKQTVTIGSSRELRRFKSDFVELIDIVRKADGKYVLYVDVKHSRRSRPSIVSKSDFDQTVGKNDDKYTCYSTQEQMRRAYEDAPRKKVLNRQEYLQLYFSHI